MKSPKCLDCGFRHFSWEDCGSDSKEEEEAPPESTPEPDPKIVKLLEDRIARVAPGVLESVNAIVVESFQKGTVPEGSGGLLDLTDTKPKPKKKTKPKKKAAPKEKKKRKSTPKDVERVTQWRKKNRERYNATMRDYQRRKKAEKENQS